MTLFDDPGQGSKFIKCPMGSSVTFTITEVQKASDPMFNLKKKNGTDVGYYYKLFTNEGTELTIGSWSLYYAFRDAKLNAGDRIELSHPGKGNWNIRKVDDVGGNLPF